jgi:hypothetical protein
MIYLSINIAFIIVGLFITLKYDPNPDDPNLEKPDYISKSNRQYGGRRTTGLKEVREVAGKFSHFSKKKLTQFSQRI